MIKKIQLIVNIIWIIALTSVYLLPSFSTETIKENLQLEFRFDYLLHVSAFCFTGILFFFGRKRRFILFCILFFGAYSYGMELLQKYHFSRTFNKYDILSNIVGLILGWIILNQLQKYIRFKRKDNFI